jgi:PAS domain S-box-containing protein
MAPYPWKMTAVFALIFVVILVAGVLFYTSEEQQLQKQVINDLTSIAKLKAGQIVSWREDRLYDARVVSAGVFFIDGVDQYLTYGDIRSRENILTRFREMNASPQYQNILLVDPEGNVHISLDPSVKTIPPEIKSQVLISLTQGDAVITDIYRVPESGQVRQDVIAPLILNDDGINSPVGAVILSIDPDSFLYPYIQSWPVPSESAETLLIERKGNNVLFLNNLRHRNDTALNLTIPLTQTEVPAVMAVLGTTGAFIGKDYRGVEVISVLEPIEGSPWHMVAKVDTEETYAGWHARSGLIILLVAGFLAGSVVIAGLFWQRRQKYYFRSLYEAEKSRREEEEFSRTVLDNSPAFYVAIDHEGNTVMMNRALRDALEYTEDEVRGRDYLTTFVPADDRDELRRVFSETLVGKNTISVNRIVSKSGRVFVVEWRGSPLGHRRGTSGVFIGIGIDITERKQAEEALQQKTEDLEAAYEEITTSEEELRANYEELAQGQQALNEINQRLRSFYEAGLFGIVFWTMDGTIIDANDAFLGMTGYSREDLETGRIGWEQITPPEFRSRDQEAVKELRLTGKNKVPFEKEYYRKDGTRLPVLIAGATLDEQRTQGVAFVLDISEKKKADETIESSRAFLDMIIDMSPFSMWISDKNGTVTRVNRSLCDAIHLTPGDIIGKYNVLSDMNLEKQGVLPAVRAVFSERRPARFSIPWKSADAGDVDFSGGRDMYIDASLFPILDARGELTHVVCQWVDITERRLIEQQREKLIQHLEQKNAELERFTYTVSHDLKSPLITIKGFAGLLEDDVRMSDPVRLRNDARRVVNAAEKMQDLLSDLLELSRVGKVLSPPARVPFGKITREAVELLEGPLKERGARVEISPDLPDVNGDHVRIREVMVNLIENAIKYSGNRPDPVIRIGVDRGGDEPIFFVQDNGIGIDPRYLERIFQLFEKLDPAIPGTGIGLPIVKQIIEMHGGRIWVESEGPGKGTTFRFTLPVL